MMVDIHGLTPHAQVRMQQRTIGADALERSHKSGA